jgi:hypothetical protein
MASNYPSSVCGGPHPLLGGGCWAHVRIARHNALGFAMFGPSYTPCSRRPRPGKLTCHQHDRHETRAQAMKKKSVT